MNLDPQTVVAVVSALIALASAWVAWQAMRENRNITKHSSNYSYIAQAEAMIRENPDLLALHGVPPGLLKELGLSPAEATYLIHSFTAGDLYYRIQGTGALTTYRKVLLECPKVRAAWKHLIRGRFVSEGTFSEAVDAHLAARPKEPGSSAAALPADRAGIAPQ